MSSENANVSLSAFPATRADALAILYLQNQDLTGKTPEEIVRMYNDAHEKIRAEFKKIHKENGEEQRKSSRSVAFYN